jgi:hypothetical protein
MRGYALFILPPIVPNDILPLRSVPPYSKWEVDEETHFKTEKNSFFIKTFFHTKYGNFGHLEGGQVSMGNVAVGPHVSSLRVPASKSGSAICFTSLQVMNEMSKLSDHLSSMGPMEQVCCLGGKHRARSPFPSFCSGHFHAASKLRALPSCASFDIFFLQDLAEGCDSDEWSD